MFYGDNNPDFLPSQGEVDASIRQLVAGGGGDPGSVGERVTRYAFGDLTLLPASARAPTFRTEYALASRASGLTTFEGGTATEVIDRMPAVGVTLHQQFGSHYGHGSRDHSVQIIRLCDGRFMEVDPSRNPWVPGQAPRMLAGGTMSQAIESLVATTTGVRDDPYDLALSVDLHIPTPETLETFRSADPPLPSYPSLPQAHPIQFFPDGFGTLRLLPQPERHAGARSVADSLSAPGDVESNASSSSTAFLPSTSVVGHLARHFERADLMGALIRQTNSHDFTGPPLPSGASLDSQALSASALSSLSAVDSGRTTHFTHPNDRLQERLSGITIGVDPAAPHEVRSQSTETTHASASRTTHRAAAREHEALMTKLWESPLRNTWPKRTTSRIDQFLRHLEQRGLRWSILSASPMTLQDTVNAAIDQHGLNPSTSAALNRVFGLALLPPSGIARLAPTDPTHQALMGEVKRLGKSGKIPKQYTSFINRFLCHLEQHGLTWVTVSANVATLQSTVDAAIDQHGLSHTTRSALNSAFNLQLRSPSQMMRTLTHPEHQTLMGVIELLESKQYVSFINRFLCHLEQHGLTWSIVSANETTLQTIVDDAVDQHGLNHATRSALNKAFGFRLKSLRKRFAEDDDPQQG